MQNKFKNKISNEELAELPTIHFQGEIVVVDTLEAIDDACNDLLKYSVIGFDTETRPSFKAGVSHKVALLQLSTPTKCYLFRLCCIRLDKAIIKIIESKSIAKIGADVKGDIKALQELRHFKPSNFVDLQSIVADWGVEEKSVKKMTALILGYKVSKAQRLSNWAAVCLTHQQQCYAATDAWVCAFIYDRLQETDKKNINNIISE